MNDIAELQNTDAYLRLQRAKTRVYTHARYYQIAQFILVVVFPLIGFLLALRFDQIKSGVAGLSLVITVLDVFWIDRSQRLLLKTAAKISERYDCNLFDLKWNKFVAGKDVDHELVSGYANAYSGGDAALRDWYPPVVRHAPLWIARIVCQRASLHYDADLRRQWATILLIVMIIVILAICLAGWVQHDSLDFLVTTVAAPATPILIWMVRERFRQLDAAEANETIKAEADSLIARIKSKDVDAEAGLASSRQFQDGIYARRSTSPMITPFLYHILRPKMETQMNEAADDLLKELDIPVS